jgi:hypothetical protein
MTNKPNSIAIKIQLITTPLLLPFDGRTQHSGGKTRRIAYSGRGHACRTQRHNDRTPPRKHYTVEHEGQNDEP